MVIANEKNFLTGVLYLLLGAAVANAALQYEMGTASRMGPGYFPFCLGLLLCLSGAVVVIGALGGRSSTRIILGSWPLKSLTIVSAAILLFALTLEPFGLIIACPLLLCVATLASPVFSWRGLLGSIAVLTVGSWLIFIKALGLRIPLLPSIFFS